LLANPDFYGTLAATRSLGARGIPVYIAASGVLAASRWSRHTARALQCPPIKDSRRFIDWLCQLGREEPGIVLYPTSDEAAYLYALHAEELSPFFRMYQPCADTMLGVLDKKRLYATARRVGLEIPETWFPESEADVARIAREVPMPLLVKPRTQVLSVSHSKGVIVRRPSELLPSYRSFVDTSRFGAALLDRCADAPMAMIQRYVPEAAQRIYVLAAFLDRSSSHYAVRAGMKIFQIPRSLGIGLCFQSAPVDARVSELVRQLAIASGYFGVFQLEFIETEGRHLLIDFNPRFYNQLAFDIARGLPLPSVVHAAARGDTDEVRDLVDAARVQPETNGLVFCNRFGFRLVLSAQLLAGRISADEASHWRRWRSEHRSATIDPADQAGDPLPWLADVASQVYSTVRHPRAFVRKIVFDRTPAS
jgi:predicted ATP-grasp superfamily ATP-dependent carboligase